MLHYKELLVWQKSVAIAIHAYKITQPFPKSELFGLTDQIRRSSVSIAANIAEGSQRGTKEYKHFLKIARGSIAELDTHLIISKEVGFLTEDTYNFVYNQLMEVGRMSASLLKKLGV